MQNSKYRNLYRERIQGLLDEQGVINPYAIDLIEFVFTRSIWIKKEGVFKAYLDKRTLITSTLLIPPSYRLLILIMGIQHEEEQIKYYRGIYKNEDIKVSKYSLVDIFTLICNVKGEVIHREIMLLIPNSPKDIIQLHYERLYSLFPSNTHQALTNILRNPSTSLTLDIKNLNKIIPIYDEYNIQNIIGPIVESNPINLLLDLIAPSIGIGTQGVNALTYIYNNLILDMYQRNQ